MKDHIDTVLLACQNGLNQFSKLHADIRLRSRQRTLAGILNDCICYEASQAFQNVSGVSSYEEDECWFFIISDRIALRFKKVDKGLHTSNIRTKKQSKIDEQQGEFPGINRLTVVSVGYQPDKLFREIKSVGLVCRLRNKVRWEIPLADTLQSYMFDNELRANTTNAPTVRPKLVVAEGTNG